MSADSEKVLLDWESDDRDPGDDLHRHFEDYGRWDWCDISDEGRRVWNLMFNDEIEEWSPQDGVFSAIAAQASHGAFAAVAAALGVDMEALRHAAAEWYENQDNLPPPVSPEQFMAKCVEAAQWLKDLRAGKFDCSDGDGERS